MTKRKSKSTKTAVKAAAVRTAVTKSSAAAPTATTPLIVLGFDEQQKPRGAKFVDAKPDLVLKAADLMGLKVYQASPPEVAELAKKLPLGRLYANGYGFPAIVVQRPRGGPCTRRPGSTEQERQQRQPAGRTRPAQVVGRDRGWPSRRCPGVT